MSRSTSRRFVFVDVLRSLAIALALAAHAVNDFKVPARPPYDEFALLRTITQAATPSFIFMFGMRLELVYARHLERTGMSTIALARSGVVFSATPATCSLSSPD